MTGVREEFRNNFNSLPALEAPKYPPCGNDGTESGST